MSCECGNCPKCVGEVFVDHMPGPITITFAQPIVDVIDREIVVPSGVPLWGFESFAEFTACADTDKGQINVTWSILLDNVVVQTRSLTDTLGDGDCSSAMIQAAVSNLAAGTHHVKLRVQISQDVLTIIGGAMRTKLVRNPGFTVTP